MIDESLEPILESVLTDLSTLEAELKQEVPEISHALQLINNNLRQYPELCPLLSDEQIQPLYEALTREVVKEVSNAKGRRKGTKGDTLTNGQKVKDLL